LTDRSVNNMSPRTASKNKAIREQRRNHILEIALELFAHNGYERTSISLIAEKAGISKGLIYNYFSGKEDLIKSLIDHLTEINTLYLKLTENEDPKIMLQTMIEVLVDSLMNHREHWKLVSELTFQVEHFDFVKTFASQKLKEYYVLLEDLFQKMNYPNPRQEAMILAAIFDGLGFQSMILKDRYPLLELKESLISKYCT
jgi:AcrR family transcriptional regulator